jgi:transposase-like protein
LSAQEKAAIVGESLAEGAVVSEVARAVMVSIRSSCSAGERVYAMP